MTDSLEYGLKLFGAFGAIILALLAWVRYRPKDRVEVEKIAAETSKLNAEADMVRSEAEVKNTASAKQVNDMAMGLINRLDDELAHEKEANGKLQLRLADMAEEIRQLQKQLFERDKELEAARAELKTLRERYGK